MGDFHLLSNHGMALVCVARNQDARLRDVADCLEITERSAHRIVSDLVEQGYLKRERRGARNHYEIQTDRPLTDPLLGDSGLGDLLAVLDAGPRPPSIDGKPDGAAPDTAQRTRQRQ